jgi:hypothetical protein
MEARVKVSTTGPASTPEKWIVGPNLLGVVFFVYLASTALLYFWGPWEFPSEGGRARLIIFLVAVHAAFAGGYVLAMGSAPSRARWRLDANRVVLVAAVVDLALLLPTSYYSTGSCLPRPWIAAQNLAAAYSDSLALRQSGTPYVNYLRILLAPLLASLVPLGVFYWQQLAWSTRILFGASTIGTIALFMAMGANAGAAHWMALFPWFVVASHLSGVHPLTIRGWAKAVVVFLASAALFASFFAASMAYRQGSYVRNGAIDGIGATIAPPEQPAATGNGGSPDRSVARIGVDGLAVYLTQGYHAIQLAMREPFVPCYGVGHSVFLQRQMVRVTGSNYFIECPYPVRIEHRGWRATVFWASIYPWLASDVTFPGTVIVLGLIGWLAGRVWLDCLAGNPIAVAFLGQLLILLYYVPAHNKVMHSGEGVAAFIAWLGLWLLSSRKQER